MQEGCIQREVTVIMQGHLAIDNNCHCILSDKVNVYKHPCLHLIYLFTLHPYIIVTILDISEVGKQETTDSKKGITSIYHIVFSS